jgi:hypothetical protein
MKPETKALVFLVAVVLILSAIIISSFIIAVNEEKKAVQEGCADDVKTCPDGSNVTRELPECVFRPCP